MKKILLGLLYLVSLLLLAGTGVVHYFTKAKMGMARYMVYFNGKIDDRLGGVGKGKVLLVILIVIVSLITMSLIVLTFKNLRGSLINKIPADLACIINAFSLFYILAFDRGKTRDYYINGFAYVTVGILIIVALLVNLRGKNETK
jgi:hypothetical protein